MIFKEVIQKGEEHLSRGPHPERARRDAESLLQHIVQDQRATFMARWQEILDADEEWRYWALINRRFRGEPIQYIIGETEFYGLPFRVARDVLIPRPETEHLVEKVLELAGNFKAPRIAEVGTGSGAIAVALAHKLPQASITATDLSAPALAVARQNAARNHVIKIKFLLGDLLAPVAKKRFDIIVSNPPYVSTADRAQLSVEVREYEPALALFAGDDGLEVYRRLIPAAFSALIPGGYVALEIGFGQSQAIAELLAGSGFGQIKFVPDLQDIPRVACAQRP
jgi:release factor glutamine methyltransferase